jgi:photosystem II stability/assembly factor-like uncharacterized protein
MGKRLWPAGALLVFVGAVAASAIGGGRSYAWDLTPTGTAARLRGVSAIGAQTAWASGSLGTVVRTTDGGQTWQQVGPPGTAALQFRDIEAFDANRAVILSIGNGTDSRVYVTADGGQTWTLSFQNTDPSAFYDCMTFFDSRRGLAVSDPVNGKFRIIATDDGGYSWRVLPSAGMPPAQPGEAGFAASGQCLVTDHGRRAWLGSGAGAQARVYRSDDGGLTWSVSSTPLNASPTAGIFALAFNGQQHGLASGGDFAAPTVSPNALATTSDGGATWTLATDPPNEYRSGAAWITGRDAIVVGPTGSDLSQDGGQTWQRIDSGSFDTVDCANPNACWASGEQGRAAHLVATH